MKLVALDLARGVAIDPYEDSLDRLYATQLLAMLNESDAELLETVAAEYPNLERAARQLRMKTERLRQEINRIRAEILQKLGGTDETKSGLDT